jgi:hypothetical protein
MTNKVAIIILTDTTEADGLGRVVNALMAAKEFKEAGDTVEVIFTGAGTKWVEELAKADHMLNPTYQDLQDVIAGACGFCAGAFGVAAGIKELGHTMLEEFGSNMSFRRLLQEGYTVLTF